MYESGLSTIKIGKIFNKHYSVVRKILLRNGVKLRSNRINSRKYKVDDNFFHDINTEEKAYWLGFIYADGFLTKAETKCKSIGISIKSSDIEHLNKFNNSIHSNYPIHIYKVSSGYNLNSEYCRVIIRSDVMYDDLVNNGVYEHKSLILNPPNNVPQNLIRHFIRGYMDGDGTISTNGNSYYVGFVGTKQVLTWIYEFLILNGLKVNFKLEKRRENCDAFSFKIFGKNAYNLLKLLYDDSTIYLNRKYEKGKKAITYFSRLYQ